MFSNEAESGGALHVAGAVLMQACTLTDNRARRNGGAVFSTAGVLIEMLDCTLTGNSAEQAGAAWFSSELK
jgi:predicted outer membrane repeat protein